MASAIGLRFLASLLKRQNDLMAELNVNIKDRVPIQYTAVLTGQPYSQTDNTLQRWLATFGDVDTPTIRRLIRAAR